MFFFKKSKVVVDCFTYMSSVHELYSIQPAIKYFPDDIKKVPNYYENVNKETNIPMPASTIKRCIGIIELYKHGAIIPMWTDVKFVPRNLQTKNGAAYLIDRGYELTMHDTRQFPGLYETYMPCKFGSPWRFREKTGIQFTWNAPLYNSHDTWRKYTIPPAVTSYKYQGETNINIFVDKRSDDFIIEAGTPMVHIIPMSDKEVVYKNHLVTIEEFYRIGIPPEWGQLMPNRYTRWVKTKKKLEASKCPFGFGK
jgi:hypothetical protein